MNNIITIVSNKSKFVFREKLYLRLTTQTMINGTVTTKLLLFLEITIENKCANQIKQYINRASDIKKFIAKMNFEESAHCIYAKISQLLNIKIIKTNFNPIRYKDGSKTISKCSFVVPNQLTADQLDQIKQFFTDGNFEEFSLRNTGHVSFISGIWNKTNEIQLEFMVGRKGMQEMYDTDDEETDIEEKIKEIEGTSFSSIFM